MASLPIYRILPYFTNTSHALKLKAMKIILLILIVSLTITTAELRKARETVALCFDSYDISSTERISLYGAKMIRWITNEWYWGEAGYGAIFGKRSGYLEGGIIVGYRNDFLKNFTYDIRLFYGAGGGGSAPQGGGMIVQPTIAIGCNFYKDFTLFIELGYMRFINGDISSASIGFGLHWDIWRLYFL